MAFSVVFQRSLLLVLLCASLTNAQSSKFKIGMVADLFLTYSSVDQVMYNGTLWWANWVNARGGLFYNGSFHEVEVISLDASTPDPSQVVARVNASYESLVNDYHADILISPYTTARTAAAMAVSLKYQKINFVTGALTESLFQSTSSYTFNAAIVSTRVAQATVKLLVGKAKSFVILRRPDSISQLCGTHAIEYLTGNGLVKMNELWMNTSATDDGQLNNLLRGSMTTLLSGVTPDAFIYAGPSTEFPNIATVISQIQPNIKAAVHLLNNHRYVQAQYNLAQTGDGWIIPTRFDRDFNDGVSGQLGGTTLEFLADFQTQFNYEAYSLDVITAGLLMSYYVVVNQTQDITPDVVRAAMKAMPEIDTFSGPIQYYANGTNMYARIAPLQLINGVGRLADSDNIIYPVQFAPKSKSLDTKKAVAIAVPLGIVFIIAVVLGIVYVHHQRKQVVKKLEEAEEGERRNYKIDYTSLTMGSAIGTGGFGVVYKGEYRGAEVAIKKLKSQAMSKAQLDEFAKESAIMIGLRHPNILLFMGVCIEPPELAIITEFMPFGSVYDIIHNPNVSLPLAVVKNMILDVLKGLQFIHSAGIIHRDLKSPNLLVDKSWNIKIADFGLSAMKVEADDSAQISLLWTAPEILKKEPGCYTDKSDIFSFAVIVWELMSRQVPYQNISPVAIIPSVVGGTRPPIDPSWNTKLSAVISACWDNNPTRRPSVIEARSSVETIQTEATHDFGTATRTSGKEKAPSGNVAFVYCQVYHAPQLWAHEPRDMARALLVFKEVIRDLLRATGGYEVKSSADASYIAFGDPLEAVNFCLRAQNSLLHANWPESITNHPDASEHRSTNGTVIFRGLSAIMGVHLTHATTPATHSASFDSEMEYFSNEVVHPIVYAGVAARGWVGMGPEMYVMIMGNTDKLDPFDIESLGSKILFGRETSTYQMTLKSLSTRESTANPDEGFENMQEVPSSAKLRFPEKGERWIIKYEDIEIREKVGSGSFGEVKLGYYKGRKVAVKHLLKQRMKDESTLELQAESVILSSLSHPNVLQFLGVCTRLPNVCLVSEYMERGSLSEVLYANPPLNLSWEQKIIMARDMAQGLAYLHSKRILHRDVKTQNMLVGIDFHVKIADLGFSRIKADNQTMTQVGTVAYSAPEIFGGQTYTEKADVYSYAIVLWELIFAKKPWEKVHPMKLIPSVTSGSRLPITNIPTGAPQNMIKVMQECWNQDPAMRPSFDTIVGRI